MAAADVGILNLTRFEAPKPQDWFFGQRRLGTEIRDVYGRLIDGMRAERGKLRSGGDGGAGGMSMKGSPPVEATLALFSGIVKVGADGTAKVEFQLPDFNGTVRLSAVAWSGDKVGSASKDVIVRDPVALTVSAPALPDAGRPGAPGAGRAQRRRRGRRLQRHRHSTSPSRRSQSQPGFERAVALDAGERKREAFQLKPGEVGLTTLAVRVTGPNGIDVRRRLTFDVKVPAGDIKRLTVSSLAAKGGKITLSRRPVPRPDPAPVQGRHHGRAHGRARRAGHPRLARPLPLRLRRADHEPRPAAALRQRRGQAHRPCHRRAVLRERIDGAIARVFEMQDASGAFGIWGPSDGDMWLTSYVTDFLTRAKEAGYAVRRSPFTQALDRLQNFISYAQDFETGGEGRAYALYVLGPQRPRADRRAALLRRHQARQLLHAAGAGPARRGAGHAGRQGARRDGAQGGARGRSPTRTTA